VKLQFLPETALFTLKGNIDSNLKNYTLAENQWITSFFDGEAPFRDFKSDVSDFTLDVSFEKPEDSDLENIKRIYTNLHSLTETQASDERLWAGLAHGQFWSYMRYRWSLDKIEPSELDIRGRYFFGHSKKRSLISNALAKLWWYGKYTYSENRENCYELTEYLSRDMTKGRLLFSSNFSSNPMITKAFLGAMIDVEKDGGRVNRTVFGETIKYLNLLGGTCVLDAFSEEELYTKIITKTKILALTQAI